MLSAAQSRDASSHVPGFREAEFRVHLSARVTRSRRGEGEEGRERSRGKSGSGWKIHTLGEQVEGEKGEREGENEGERAA